MSNSHMLSKVFFPRLLLPLSGLVSTSVDFAIGLAMFVLVALTLVTGITLFGGGIAVAQKRQ